MKKVLTWVVVVIMMLATFAACTAAEVEKPAETQKETQQAEESKTPAPVAEEEEKATMDDAKGLKIALFIKNQVNQVFLDGQAGAQKCADEYGVELSVLAPTTPNSNDEQVDQIVNTIAKGVDAMVISPCDTSGVVSAIEMARAEGIKVIIIADTVTETEVDGTAKIDNEDAAYQVTKKLCEKLNGQGNVVIITPPLGTPTGKLLLDGSKRALAEFPNIEILGEQPGNFLRTEGMKVMEDFLQTYDNIDAVVGLNDEMSLGAIEAIKAAGKTAGESGILVASLDASVDGIKAMVNGEIYVNIDKNWSGVGYAGVYDAIQACLGIEFEKDHIVETVLVTDANLDEYAKLKGAK